MFHEWIVVLVCKTRTIAFGCWSKNRFKKGKIDFSFINIDNYELNPRFVTFDQDT